MSKKYKRLLLVNPGNNPAIAYAEPLNIAILASFIRKQGFGVKIADEMAGESVEDIVDSFKPDLIGVTSSTPLADDAYRVGRIGRDRKINTVAGGPHASAVTEESLEHFDMIVQGEGELALLDIMNKGIQKGIIKSDKVFNIDHESFPARDLLRMDFYLKMRQRNANSPHFLFVPLKERLISLIISRGCYWNCVYCYNSWREYPCRYRSPKLVAQEMDFINQKYDVTYFNFLDDNLFGNQKYSRLLMQEMKKNKRKYIWGANSRVDCVNDNILSLALEAGCRRIDFGFESGSQKVLDILNKRVKVENIKKSVDLCRKYGIQVVGTFMLGSPGETMEDINKTRDLVQSLPLAGVGFGFTTPLPGTKLWEMASEKGKIPEKLKWPDFDFDHIPIEISDYFTPKQLIKLRRKIFIETYLKNRLILWNTIKMFFLNPRAILKRVKNVCFPEVN